MSKQVPPIQVKQLKLKTPIPALKKKSDKIGSPLISPRSNESEETPRTYQQFKPEQKQIQLPPIKTFFVELNQYSITDLTINKIPIIIDLMLKYINEVMMKEPDWFEDKPFSTINNLPKFENVEEDVLMTTVSEMDKKKKKELIQMGFTMEEARKVKEIAHQENNLNFFRKLNKNENISNNEMTIVNKLLRQSKVSRLPEIYHVRSLKTMFVVLKLYLLYLPSAVVNKQICYSFDEWNSNEETVVTSEMVFKLFQQNTSPIGLKIVKELLMTIRSIVYCIQTTKEEIESLYKCYFNALTQSELFRKKHVKYLNLLFEGERKQNKDNVYEMIEGEYVIESYENVICPYYQMGNEDILSSKHIEMNKKKEEEIKSMKAIKQLGFNDDMSNSKYGIEGTLFITNCRIVFAVQKDLSVDKMEMIKYCGNCWLKTLKGYYIREEQNDGWYLHLSSSEMKKLTFKFNQNPQQVILSINGLINGKISLTETRLLSKDYCFSVPQEKLIEKEMRHMNIKRVYLDKEKGMYPLFPVFKPRIKCKGYKERVAMIVYRHKNGNKILRYPHLIKKEEEKEIEVELKSEARKMEDKTIEVFECKQKMENEFLSEVFDNLITALCTTGTTSNFTQDYYTNANILSVNIAEFVKACMKVADMLLKEDKVVLLIPSEKENLHLVSVYSCLIQMIVEPRYRTIDGFLELFQKEIILFKYPFEESSISKIPFLLFCYSLQMIIEQNNTLFEFDNSLVQFMLTHLYSQRFSEFKGEGINIQCSFVEYVHGYQHYFRNPNYTKNADDFVEIDFHLLTFHFDTFQNYSKNTIECFNEEVLKNDVVSFNSKQLSLFPPFPLPTSYFNQIKTLDISHNQLKDFPIALCKMTQLEQLSLKSNQICFITKQISNLTNLNSLDISDNRIKSLPSLQAVPLTHLNISNNYFPQDIYIDVNDCIESLEWMGLKRWNRNISEMNKLTALNVSNSPGINLKALIANAPPKLRKLTLERCDIRKIPEQITTLQLTSLNVANNFIRKMNFTFFQWETLVELDLSNNILKKKSVLFQDMQNLMTVKLSNLPKRFVNEQEVPQEEEKVKQVEKVVVTGDDLRNEVFDYLSKKMKDYGEVVEISSTSFTFEVIIKGKKTKKKDGIKHVVEFVNQAPNIIEENQWNILRTIFVVCKSGENDFGGERILEMLLYSVQSLNPHFVTISPFDKSQSPVINECIISIHESPADKLRWPSLPKKLNDQLIDKLGDCPNACGMVLNEIRCLDFDRYCISEDRFQEILHALGLIDQETEIMKWLEENEYLLKAPKSLPFLNVHLGSSLNDKLLINFEFFRDILDVFSSYTTSTGFFTTRILDRINIKPENILFLLILMQQYGVAFLVLKETAEELNMVDKFNEVYSLTANDLEESFSSGSDSMSQSTESSMSVVSIPASIAHSVTPRTPRTGRTLSELADQRSIATFLSSFRKEGVERMENNVKQLKAENILIYPCSSLISHETQRRESPRLKLSKKSKDMKKKSFAETLSVSGTNNQAMKADIQWDSTFAVNEIVNGRIFYFERMNVRMAALINASFALKFSVHQQWKNGIITYAIPKGEKEKVFMMVEEDLNKKSVIIRMRYVVESEKSCILSTQLWREASLLLNNVATIGKTVISEYYFLCPNCLQKNTLHIMPMETFKECCDKRSPSVTIGNCKINIITCLLDKIIEYVNTDYLMNIDNFKLIKTLATGSNSVIGLYECLKAYPNIKKGQKVVIKLSNLSRDVITMNGKDKAIHELTYYINEYLREISFILFNKHKNIAGIYGFSFEPVMIVMEYFNGGNLFNFIHDEQLSKQLTRRQILLIAKQIAEGMNMLHSSSDPILHRDMKSPNIVIRMTEENTIESVAITDFGMSTPLSLNDPSYIECPYWLAPEVIENKMACLQSDVYSFGIILWEMTTKEYPFNEFRFNSEIEEKVMKGYRPELNKKEKYLNDLITCCWDQKVDCRPTFADIIQMIDMLLSKTKD